MLRAFYTATKNISVWPDNIADYEKLYSETSLNLIKTVNNTNMYKYKAPM
jgi:hypothetical protein